MLQSWAIKPMWMCLHAHRHYHAPSIDRSQGFVTENKLSGMWKYEPRWWGWYTSVLFCIYLHVALGAPIFIFLMFWLLATFTRATLGDNAALCACKDAQGVQPYMRSHENETSTELQLEAAFTLHTEISYDAKVRQRSTNSSFKVGAFKINTNCFNSEK